MPRTKKGSLPTYRLHKARGLAVVTIDGHDYYLGPFGSPSSKQKYTALLRAWQERQERLPEYLPTPLEPNDRTTINELILAYLTHVGAHYKPNHGRNKEAGCVDDALKIVQACGYGREPADSFRPKDLKKVREAMIARDWSRSYVNHQITRIKRMFGYAVEEDLIPGSVFHALKAVKGLRKGTPGVREARKVKPVPVGHLKPVLAQAHKLLKAMLRVAYWTGARPGEVCALKPCYLDTSGKVWVYRVPAEANKTDHHDQERKIFIGPRAQKVLRPFLEGQDPDQYLFSPVREQQLRQQARSEARKTPRTPSEIKRFEEKKTRIPKIRKRDHYDPAAFRQAVIRLCDAVNVPRWTPNRLRHNAATRFRKKYGVEIARILLGHRKLNTTEVYAERDSRPGPPSCPGSRLNPCSKKKTS